MNRLTRSLLAASILSSAAFALPVWAQAPAPQTVPLALAESPDSGTLARADKDNLYAGAQPGGFLYGIPSGQPHQRKQCPLPDARLSTLRVEAAARPPTRHQLNLRARGCSCLP